MRQTGVVIRTDENTKTADVRVLRESACAGCHKNCGEECELTLSKQPPIVVTVQNTQNASAGDRVTLETDSRQLLSISALVYLIPVVLFALVRVLLGNSLPQGAVIGMSMAAFLAGFALCTILCNRLCKKHLRYRMCTCVF